MTGSCAGFVRRSSATVAILVLGAGCTARTYTIEKAGFLSRPEVSVSPAGTEATIRVRAGGVMRGELIAVRADGFIILSTGPAAGTRELVLVPYIWMARIDFRDDVGANTSVGSTIGPWFTEIPALHEDRIRQHAIARFSRYPFGIDETQLQRLLEAYGQSELIVYGS